MLRRSIRFPARDRRAPFILTPALLLLVAAPAMASTVYDFSSGGGTTHFAWGTYTDSFAEDLDGQRRKTPEVGTEVTTVRVDAYTALAASDATGNDSDPNRYENPIPAAEDESTLIVEFDIAEDPGNVTQLDVLWEGYSPLGQISLYIWSYAAGNWSNGAGLTGVGRWVAKGSGISDFVLSGSVTSNVSDYISGTGQITLLIYCEDANEPTLNDYVSVTVTATGPAVPAMSDGVQIVLVLLLSVLGIAGVVDLRRSRA